MSRVFGGIHYRFDSDIGLRQGRAIGELAIRAAERRARRRGSGRSSPACGHGRLVNPGRRRRPTFRTPNASFH
ncbi:MAG TPA: hypothetical protein VFZ21_14810 [Gemmatimonadaceae bacterium]|nr:hypothetical protein [Gemmatimonadaceae bacterium]